MSSSSSSLAVTAVEPEHSGVGEIMLFGVRVVVDSMRKSVSLNNLSQYEQPHETAKNGGVAGGTAAKDDVAPLPPPPLQLGYASENDAIQNSSGSRERERKRGIPWTEDEHKLFLLGLQKVGKGDWRGISRNFVKTRTPTQVASHAQKYFLRRNNHNRRRRRSSLFDITTDTVSAIPMEAEQANSHHHQDDSSQSRNIIPSSEPCNPSFSLVSASPMTVDNQIESLPFGHKNPANNNANNNKAIFTDLNLNLKLNFDASHLSLKLSLPTDPLQSSSSSSSSASSSHFQTMPGFNNGDK